MRLQVLATPRLLSVPFRRHRGVSCIHSASETNWFQQCRITCQVDGGHGEDLWGRVYNISALRELADGEILDGAAACAEARLLQRSNHKHVAPLRDVVLAPEAGLLVLVWSYFSGGSLLERFERLCSNGSFRQPPHLPCRERCDPAGVGLRAGADLIDSLCFSLAVCCLTSSRLGRGRVPRSRCMVHHAAGAHRSPRWEAVCVLSHARAALPNCLDAAPPRTFDSPLD
jgi:hypothetical protein